MKFPIHLNALRAFEASARHKSFSAAAAELHVTPAAVGQLVRSLEDSLGSPLFHRVNTGPVRLVMTEIAERALPDIREGFEKLALGLEKLKSGAANSTLTVTVSPAFAAKWLPPRFERFQAQYPDMDLRLETSLKPVDFALQQVDIGVRYGTGCWQGLQAEKMMDEEVYPVCSPGFLALNSPISKPADLKGVTLIHDLSMDGHTGFANWEQWLQKAGLKNISTLRGIKINNSAAVLQAAIEGRGVALARSVMAQDDVATGRLLRLFPDMQFASSLAYYVVYRPECASLPKVASFRDWLLQEAVTKKQDRE
ncbi:MAG: transcriptional regulator GcvA [Gammaproteobacteria bacterium]